MSKLDAIVLLQRLIAIWIVTMFRILLLRNKIRLILAVVLICPCLWILYKFPALPLQSTLATQPHEVLQQNSSGGKVNVFIIYLWSSMGQALRQSRRLQMCQLLLSTLITFIESVESKSDLLQFVATQGPFVAVFMPQFHFWHVFSGGLISFVQFLL